MPKLFAFDFVVAHDSHAYKATGLTIELMCLLSRKKKLRPSKVVSISDCYCS